MLDLLSRPTPLEVQLERQCGLPPGLTLAHPDRFSVALEVTLTHGSLDQAVASSSGWQLGEVLRQLPAVAEVDDWTLIEMLKGFEKLERFMHAQKVRVLADLGERRLDTRGSWSHDGEPEKTWLGRLQPPVGAALGSEISRHAAQEVGLALGIPRVQAAAELTDAFTMSRRLPQVIDSLEQGRLSGRAATTLNEQTLTLSPDLARVAVDRVLRRPGVVTVAQTRAAIRSAAIAVDPDTARRRELAAVKGRTVDAPRGIEDGMGYLAAYLTAPDLVATYERLSRLAEATRTADDTRTAGARRADVLVDLVAGRPVLTADGRNLLDGADAPTAPRRRWRTDVVIAASTLLGTDDNPGQLVGYGPVTAQTARYLAGPDAGDDPPWRRILTDPVSGITTDYGTTRYRPPDSLADFVRARDGHCYSPICTMPAHRCDLDHLKNSPVGPSPNPDPDGVTADHNVAPACRADHSTKSAPGWMLRSPRAGTYTWTTPTGHTYTRHPEPPLDDGGGPAPPAPDPDAPPPF